MLPDWRRGSPAFQLLNESPLPELCRNVSAVRSVPSARILLHVQAKQKNMKCNKQEEAWENKSWKLAFICAKRCGIVPY